MAYKGENHSVKVKKYYFCNGTLNSTTLAKESKT
jgi:hypothetical protein